METARVAVWSSRIAITGLLLFLLGPILRQLGAPPELGFRIFGLGGVLLAFIAVVMGAAGLWATRASTGRAGRGSARLGALLGIALLGVTLGAAAVSSISSGGAAALPPINDITTSPDDPPAFKRIAELEANSGQDMAYPGASFAEQQREAYPDLETLRLKVPPGRAFQDARDAVTNLGWEIVNQDPMSGVIEAMDVTAVFKFVDDVVIRIRPAEGGGALIDVRSKSRDGRGDLGANAGRIRTLLGALED